MLDVRLKRNIERHCKHRAPEDTRNLKDNAINGKKWGNPRKFTVNYSIIDAYYIEYLENKNTAGGSLTKRNQHKGFILKTYLELADMLDNHFNGRRQFNSYNRITSDFNLSKTLRHINSLERNQVIRETALETVSQTIGVN